MSLLGCCLWVDWRPSSNRGEDGLENPAPVRPGSGVGANHLLLL